MSPPAHALNALSVMADSSMDAAMAKLARDYSSREQQVVNVSLAPSDSQQLQISEGGAADILITTKLAWIEQLKNSGLVDVYSQTPVARGRLALAGPRERPLQIYMSKGFPTTQLIQQFGWEPAFVIGNPEYLFEGVFSKQALRNMRLLEVASAPAERPPWPPVEARHHRASHEHMARRQ